MVRDSSRRTDGLVASTLLMRPSGAFAQRRTTAPLDAVPVAHGLTIWNGTLWYCDDIGVVCRMSI